MDIDMDIKELEAFVYVVENCSFSRAAELLHLTQPTISSHVSALERKLNIIGIAGERKTAEEIDEILQERRKNWRPREPKYRKGVLRLFSQHAASPMKGAYLEY